MCFVQDFKKKIQALDLSALEYPFSVTSKIENIIKLSFPKLYTF